MPGFQLVFAALTGHFDKAFAEMQKPIAVACTGAINDAKNYAVTKGRANIASAGFSSKWQNTLRGNVYPRRGVSLDPATLVYHKIPYSAVFEDGMTIPGKPLLWLPLPGVPNSVFGKHMSPANYVRQVGPLHTIYVPGKAPMLAGWILGGVRGPGKVTVAKLVAGSRAAKNIRPGAPQGRLVSIPLFYGISSVDIQKKFNLAPIFVEAKDQLGKFYLANLKT
jgi:hypothetical protein